MSVCLCATIVCAAAAAASVALASESDPRSAGRGPAADGTGIAERTLLSPALSQRATARLAEGIRVGHERLRSHASCRALFERLGRDGAATLDRASYHPASPEQESRHCRRGVYALTTVGASAVALCRGFARLSGHQAAIILIHEALHLAGQPESPAAPGAPPSLAITEMVMKGCWLF
jgi:hypothetical protein